MCANTRVLSCGERSSTFACAYSSTFSDASQLIKDRLVYRARDGLRQRTIEMHLSARDAEVVDRKSGRKSYSFIEGVEQVGFVVVNQAEW